MDNTSFQNIDTGLACFAILANFFEKPISIDQIKHKYDRQNSHFEEYELLQLAKEFSFKARLHSFKYAFRGVFLLFRYEHNAWIHLIAIVCAVTAGIILSLTSLEWVAILFAIRSVLAAEDINTAIEKLADFVSPAHQVLIGKAKDLAAAAAVLILSICAFIIGGIIFIPKIIHF